MSTPTTLNGVSYAIPAVNDGNWGTVVSNYLIALSTGTLTKAGGTFTLTAEVNFGVTHGIKVPYVKSQGTNPAGTGVFRLANSQAVSWRNFSNNADLPLIATTADRLSFNSVIVPTISSTDELTNKTIDTATNVITNLRDANIASDAAISYGKLDLTGQVTDSDLAIGSISYDKLVLTDSIGNDDISATADIEYSKLLLTDSITNDDISAVANIQYSKLALTGAVLATDLAGSIPYSKLILSGAVTDTDLAGGISYSKLVLTGAVTATDLAGSIPYSKLILTGAVQNADLVGPVSIAKGGTGQTTANTALNALLPNQAAFAGFVLTTDGTNTSWTNPAGLTNPMNSVGDIIVGGTLGAATRLAVGASGTVLKGGTTPSYAQIVDADVSASASLSYSKLALTGAVTNSDLAGSIQYSKLVLTGAVTNADLAGSIAYSKLVLTGAVTNADLAGSIALTKLANQTAGTVIIGNGSSIPTATALSGDVTVSSSGVTAIGSGVIVDADVSGSAAIAGTKVSPNFGSQNVVTTGTLGAGATTVTSVVLGSGSVLNTYITGTYAASWLHGANGFASNTITYTRIGNQVTISLPSTLNNASAAVAPLTVAGLPANMRPTATVQAPLLTRDAGSQAAAVGRLMIDTTGLITVYTSNSGGNFTASGGQCGLFQAINFTFLVV